ncbi:hypothetical protein K7432_000926 [Basidiobolus ranarum]|uniref:SMP-LTD domain-containing protein n=1 Tax=Basidiobolus ranarum TaxID=34480 RepID=A0ABR2X3W6_9FUNG
MAFFSHLLAFLLGGVIIAPMVFLTLMVLLFLWLNGIPTMPKPSPKCEFEEIEKPLLVDKDVLQDSRVGWLRITSTYNLTPRNAPIDLSTLLASGVNSLLEGKFGTVKAIYYVILSRDTMWLYTDESLLKCLGIIDLTKYEVSIFPASLPDNEVFHKDLPIQLKKRRLTNENENILPRSEYYIFSKTPVEKEDWYLGLLKASRIKKNPSEPGIERNTTDFDHAAIYQLIRTVHSDEHHLQTQWLNAFLGRIFLSIYKTQSIKDYFIRKIVLKSSKVKKPSFLGDIAVRDLHVGDSMPTITNPKLLDLQPNGEMTAEFCINYVGGFSVEVETEAIISVTARLKPLKVNLVLAVTLKNLSGRMHLKVKPPPTNRFWLGFCEDPVMSLNIEPIVSDKQLKFGMVIQAIERRIHDMIHEALVLPNMDDYPFFPSHGTGGIFDDAAEPKESEQELKNPIAETVITPAPKEDKPTNHSVENISLGREELTTPTEMFEEKDDAKSIASLNENETLETASNITPSEQNNGDLLLSPPPQAHLHPDKEKERDHLLPRTTSISKLADKGLKNVTNVTRNYASSQNTELKDKREWLGKKKSGHTSPVLNPVDKLENPIDKPPKKKLLPNLFPSSQTYTNSDPTSPKSNELQADNPLASKDINHQDSDDENKRSLNHSLDSTPSLISVKASQDSDTRSL